jgi:hypothetical protein
MEMPFVRITLFAGISGGDCDSGILCIADGGAGK